MAILLNLVKGARTILNGMSETVKNLGSLQRKKFQKSEYTMEVGGCVQVSLGIFFWSKNIPK